MDTFQTVIKQFEKPAFLNWLHQEFTIDGITHPISRCELLAVTESHKALSGDLAVEQKSDNAPLRLTVKLTTAEAGCSELAFHRIAGEIDQVAPVSSCGLLLESQTCFLLMPDINKSHSLACHAQDTFTGFILPPPQQNQVLKTLADYHNSASLLIDEAEALGYGRYRKEPRPLLASIPRASSLVDNLPSSLLPSGQKERLKALLPHAVHYWNTALKQKIRSKEGLTICHGNCLAHYFLTAKEHKQQSRLCGFDQATIHSPVWDLVTLLSTGNFPNRDDSLKCYHQYANLPCSLDELKEEYRQLCLCQIFHVLAEREEGIEELNWRVRFAHLLRQIE